MPGTLPAPAPGDLNPRTSGPEPVGLLGQARCEERAQTWPPGRRAAVARDPKGLVWVAHARVVRRGAFEEHVGVSERRAVRVVHER